MIQIPAREETADRETEFKRAVEDALGTEPYVLDLREAAYLVAMEHPGEVADQLREWGCDI